MTDNQFIFAVANAIRLAPNTAQAAANVYELCIAKAKADGMKPDIEVAIHRPDQERHHSEIHTWGVCFEAGPYDWAVDASIEAVSHGPCKVYAEPYYGFDLSFYECNP